VSVIDKEIIRYKDGETVSLRDKVVKESWLDLYVNRRVLLQIPVTDQDLEALIYGYLYMEGYLKKGERLKIEQNDRGYHTEIDGEVKPMSPKDLVDCAMSKIELGEIIEQLPPGPPRSISEILRISSEFQRLPSLFHETGGVHMAALARDEILFSADDISRRNAVDKVLGKAFLSDQDLEDTILLSSGRISSDIVMRAIRVGIRYVVSKSAPTDKAIDLAESHGLCICGFTRGRRSNVYCHRERILFS